MADKDLTDPKNWRLATKLVRGGVARSDYGETSEALFLTSSFSYETAEVAEARFKGEAEGYTYSRLANPTVAMFEERMALIDGADHGKATATGMAAVSGALMCYLNQGDHLVSSKNLFGSCRIVVEEILPRFGVEVTLVDGADNAQWEEAIRKDTKALFLETPSNPTLDVIDLEFVCGLAKDAGARVIVDNVFASPVLQKPREFGADVVVYSGTKHIDGQGRVLGGCILCDEEFFEDHLNQFTRHTGSALSPFNAWVLHKGLETLDLRVHKMCENAAEMGDFLAELGRLEDVRYPGRKDHPQHELAMKQMSAGGTMVSFRHKDGKDGAFDFMNRLKIIDISNNLGDAKSLVTHPATTSHQRISEAAREDMGITQATLRLSVGLEDPEDLKADILQALGE